ncbi:MAG: acetamidase/formamidase family protein [Gracilibacteraceae bacterium]|jgi:amidase|nr:acetamidase/formamidase family protein [Gracilibacteraceae bacterium]
MAIIPIIEKTFFHFDPKNEPAATVDSGEIVVLKTRDAFDNGLQPGVPPPAEFDLEAMDPATGPVFVRGAQPGDVLKVDILDIKVYEQGVTMAAPNVGTLRDTVETRAQFIKVKDGWIEFKKDWLIQADPMIGVIGTTPLKRIHAGWQGDFGGNIDTKQVKKGAIIYLPVYVDGALFGCGDLHAVQGDGELCGTGVEIPGEVTVRLSVLKGLGLTQPVVETYDKWYVIATNTDFYEGQRKAMLYMQKLICQAYGFDNTEAFMYLSLQGDFENSQVCLPAPCESVFRIGVPKVPGKPLIK